MILNPGSRVVNTWLLPYKTGYIFSPSVMGSVNQFLQVPFQMLKAFHIPVPEILAVIDQIVVMHDSRCFVKCRQDAVLHNSIQVFIHVGSVQGQPFIPIEADTGSGSINENNSVIPIKQGGSDATGTDLICKVVEFCSMAFLDLGKISFAD